MTDNYFLGNNNSLKQLLLLAMGDLRQTEDLDIPVVKLLGKLLLHFCLGMVGEMNHATEVIQVMSNCWFGCVPKICISPHVHRKKQ